MKKQKSDNAYSVIIQNPYGRDDGFLIGSWDFYHEYSEIAGRGIRDVTYVSPEGRKARDYSEKHQEVLHLLSRISDAGNPYVMLVNHSRTTGMILQIAGFDQPYRSTLPLAYLLFMVAMRKYHREIYLDGAHQLVDRQRTGEQWLPLIGAMATREILLYDHKLSDLASAKLGAELIDDAKLRFGSSYRGLDSEIHPEARKRIESFLKQVKDSNDMDATVGYRELIQKLSEEIVTWMDTEVFTNLNIAVNDLNKYQEAIDRVYKVRIQDVQVCACNFAGGEGDGDSFARKKTHNHNMKVLSALLGPESITAPIVYCVLSSPRMEILSPDGAITRARDEIKAHRSKKRDWRYVYRHDYGPRKIYAGKNPTSFKTWNFVHTHHGDNGPRTLRRYRKGKRPSSNDVVLVYENSVRTVRPPGATADVEKSYYESEIFADNPEAVRQFVADRLGNRRSEFGLLEEGGRVRLTWLKAFPPALPKDRTRMKRLTRSYRVNERLWPDAPVTPMRGRL